MKLISEVEYEKLVQRGLEQNLIPNPIAVTSFQRRNTDSSSILTLTNLSDDIKLALFNTIVKGLRTQYEELSQRPIPVAMKEDKVVQKHKPHNHEDVDAMDSEEIQEGLMDCDEKVVELLPPSYR
jgi:hypothetical protein